MLLHVLQRLVAQPELSQQPKHHRWMADGGVFVSELLTHSGEDLAIEVGHRVLLLLALPLALGVANGKGRHIEEVEQLDVLHGDVAIPTRHATSGDDDEA
jgi:hypothetical protein